MHPESMLLMMDALDSIRWKEANVLDVGSMDVNGTFRPMVERRGWKYTGLDLDAGPNVDIVTEDPYNFPLMACEFDIVISGSTMEHVESIWLWVPELVRVLRPGGFLAIHTHWSAPLHRYPVDTWRIMPDGMKHLFDLTGQLERYDIFIANETDIMGLALKKGVG